MNKEKADIAIIGGTGVYDPGLLNNTKKIKVYSPFGATSDLISIGDYNDTKIAFLPRHGYGHHLPPHQVPYRANLWALKELGVKRIIAPRAVGSLNENMHPGDIVISDQFIDFTKSRNSTFYGGGTVCHVSMSEPMCGELRSFAINAAEKLELNFHKKGTSLCIEGPRYSSRAESVYFKDILKADLIGMTLVPECVLARELEMCYLSIEMVTDYDAWSDEYVTANIVEKVMKKNVKTMRNLVMELLPNIPKERDNCICPTALTHTQH